jgi:hypothetical protein
MVTHYDVSSADIETAIKEMQWAVKGKSKD